MTNHHHNGGFVKIIVVVIILMLVFVMSGFNIRDGASTDRIRSTATKIISSIENTYQNHAHKTISQYILQPGYQAGRTLNRFVISRIKSTLRKIINSPPAIQNVPNLPLISFADTIKQAPQIAYVRT